MWERKERVKMDVLAVSKTMFKGEGDGGDGEWKLDIYKCVCPEY